MVSSAGSACLAAALPRGSCAASCRDCTSCCSDSAWTCAENTDPSALQNGLPIVTTDLCLKIYQKKIWNRASRVYFRYMRLFWNFIYPQLQIKNTCRHGFTYNILILKHSTFLKGSLTWAAFCLASSSCLWLSKASCSALIFQRAKSRSWRCCCAYRSGKQLLTMQVKYKGLICLSHWFQLPLKDLDLLCWGCLSCWNRIFNPLTLFLFKAMCVPHTLPPQCRKEFRRSTNKLE